MAAAGDNVVWQAPDPMEQVNRELSEIEDELGPGARDVFDDPTSMQQLWGRCGSISLLAIRVG